MTACAYQTVDVFTSTRFGGNPLAVVPDARGLSDAAMQRIAREFNYSESTFVLPPDDPTNTVRVRIFTPTAEIPFAGHPNVGTGFVIARQGHAFGNRLGDSLRFEELAGIVDIEIMRDAGQVLGARITAPEPFSRGPELGLGPDLVAECASLTASDLILRNHPPVLVSVGLPFVVCEVPDLATLARSTPDMSAFREANAHIPSQEGGLSLFVYTVLSKEPVTVQARMFAPLDNVPEDPATGSASGALGGLLALLRAEPDLDFAMTIQQGYEMGRPSRIEVSVAKRGGEVVQVKVSGHCVAVMAGTIEI